MLSLGEAVFASEHGGAADAAAHASEQVLLRGFLLKRGAVVENWKRRYCSLTRTQAGIFKLTYAEAENGALHA
jgi:hypothetical protein